jgi:hypothetical protein
MHLNQNIGKTPIEKAKRVGKIKTLATKEEK